MKNILLAFLLIISTVFISEAQENWPALVYKEQIEYVQIMLQITSLKEQFILSTCDDDPMSSPVLKSTIEQLLRQIGTHVSYKIYQEMKASREL